MRIVKHRSLKGVQKDLVVFVSFFYESYTANQLSIFTVQICAENVARVIKYGISSIYKYITEQFYFIYQQRRPFFYDERTQLRHFDGLAT